MPGAAALLLPWRGAGRRNAGQRGAVPRRAEPCRAGQGGTRLLGQRCARSGVRFPRLAASSLRFAAGPFRVPVTFGGGWGKVSPPSRPGSAPVPQDCSPPGSFPARPGSRAEGGWRCLWQMEVNSPLTKSWGTARKGVRGSDPRAVMNVTAGKFAGNPDSCSQKPAGWSR